MLKLFRRVIGKENGESTPHEAGANLPVQSPVDEEIPRYPPFVRGLPASHPERLIESQQELIGQIRESGLASKEIFEQYYLEPLRRFASYAHLLPASESHHHRGAGGLFRHAIEVGLWSLQSGDRVLLPGDQTPRRRRELESRWHSAVFLAALCHDVGKPITDLTVTSQDGETIWDPYLEDLYSWAVRNRIDRYFLRWRKNRGTTHKTISILLVERIISRTGLGWISQGDPNLVTWMMEAISGYPSQENMIHNLIIRSDQVSVERDIESLGANFSSFEIGIPVERILLDIMRRLVRDGVWIVNEPGSRVWHMEGHLYLIWPSGGEEMAAIINQEKMPGLPRTPNSILDMLIERKLAEFRGPQGDGNRYWLIAPAVLAEKIPNIRLSAIRLSHPLAILDSLPPSVPGKLVSNDTLPDKLPAVGTEVHSTVPVDPPAIDAGRISAKISEQQTAADTNGTPSDQLDGPVGEALKALADDIQQGRRDGAKLLHIDAEGVLCLKWPDSFKGYGLESKAILDELGRRNWLVVDPMSPFRKVTEVRVGIGAPWKVIRLQPILKELIDIKREKKHPNKAAVKVKESVSEAPAPLPEVASVRPFVSSKDPGAVEKMIAKQLALITEVVSVLNQAVTEGVLTAEEKNGYLLIKVREAEAVLKSKIKASRAQIFALKTIDPDRLTTLVVELITYFRVRRQ